MPAVPPGGLIVVTGASGYVASHTCIAALNAGLRVRGTVRSVEKAKELPATLEKQGADISKLELVVLDDLLNEAQYETAFQGADGVAHIAAPFLPGDVVQLFIDANLAMLRAASRVPSIKCIVLTSSCVAAILAPDHKDHTLTDEDWNDYAVGNWLKASDEDKERALRYDWFKMYSCGKTLAEKEAWKWMQQNKPTFDLVSILAGVNWGPVIFGGPHSTADWIHKLLNGDVSVTNIVYPQWFIDVRDVGRLHAIALTKPSVSNTRLWAVAAPWGWNQVMDILRKRFPNAKIPEDISGKRGEINVQKIDNKIATELLGDWISLEQSLVDTGKAYGF